MSEPTPLNTAEEAYAAIVAVIKAHPDSVNPVVDGWCLYTDRDDPSRHCLIGQLAVDLGWTVPGPYAQGGAWSAARDFGWPVSEAAVNVMLRFQGEADALSTRGLPWSEIDPSNLDTSPGVW